MSPTSNPSLRRFAPLMCLLLTPLVPAAGAQNFTADVTIAGDNPDIELNDTTASDASWELCTDSFGCDSVIVNSGYNESFHIGWTDDTPDEAGLPFVLRRGAPTDSFHMDPSGLLGLGTAVPMADLDIVDGTDGATLRLEDMTTGDAASIEMQFGTLDVVSAGSTIMRFLKNSPSLSIATAPDRVSLAGEAMTLLAGAPVQSLTVDTEGDVGLGTLEPRQQLEIQSANPTIQFTDLEASEDRNWYLNLNASASQFDISYGVGGIFSASPVKVFRGAQTNALVVGKASGPSFTNTRVGIRTDEPEETLHVAGTALVEDAMFVDGNLTVGGSFFVTSSREKKEVVGPVDPRDVLAKVATLPLKRWSYTDAIEPGDVGPARTPVHLGPMAEDFRALFGLGHDGRSLAPIDGVGVALAAIQGLHAEVAALRIEVSALRDRRAALESEMGELRSLVLALADGVGPEVPQTAVARSVTADAGQPGRVDEEPRNASPTAGR
ncbi:MAG: tail fiber domain-containing protein [Acidobacteriota bacterium]